MTQSIDVFYIGPKAEKRDNVNVTNGARGRIWRGFGSKLSVPAEEAQVLLNYNDIWCDEDSFAAFEKIHAEKQSAAKAVADRLELREQQIAEEQRRAAELARGIGQSPGTEGQDDGSEQVDRDVLLRSAILMLDPASDKDYTKTKPQKPRVDRIIEITSASFSAAEITAAFQELVASGQVTIPE